MTTSRLAGLVILGLGLHLAAPAAEAQPTARIRRVGFLTPGGGCGPTASDFVAFRERLGQLGWLEGKNVGIVCRTGDGKFERLPALAADLVALDVEVIVLKTARALGLAVPPALLVQADEVIE